MLRRYLPLMTAFAFVSPAAASAKQKMSVHNPLCKQITMSVVEKTQSSFERYNGTETVVFLHNPIASSVAVSCLSRPFLHVVVGADSPFPDDTWFYVAAQAASAMSPDSLEHIEQTLRSCHREALKEDGSPGYGEITDAHIECYSYSEDKITTAYIYLKTCFEIGEKFIRRHRHTLRLARAPNPWRATSTYSMDLSVPIAR